MQTKNQTVAGTACDLNHPSSEEWMCFLYDETTRSEAERLAVHLKSCPECQARVQDWRGTMRQLAHWEITPRRAPRRHLATAAKWGAAAAVMITIGFSMGRVFKPVPVNATEMRASIKSEIRQELLAETSSQKSELENFKARLDQQRREDAQAILAAMSKIDTDRQQELISLRKDLETVAVLTQASFRQANQQIATLEARPVSDLKTDGH